MLIYIFPIIKLHARSSSAVRGGIIWHFCESWKIIHTARGHENILYHTLQHAFYIRVPLKADIALNILLHIIPQQNLKNHLSLLPRLYLNYVRRARLPELRHFYPIWSYLLIFVLLQGSRLAGKALPAQMIIRLGRLTPGYFRLLQVLHNLSPRITVYEAANCLWDSSMTYFHKLQTSTEKHVKL